MIYLHLTCLIIITCLVGIMALTYQVKRQKNGDQIDNRGLACNIINADSIVNQPDSCLCIKQGTFYSSSSDFYPSCYDNSEGINSGNSIKFRNVNPVLMAKWNETLSSWTLPPKMLSFSDNTLISISDCPFLTIHNDSMHNVSSAQVMLDEEWYDVVNAKDVFNIIHDDITKSRYYLEINAYFKEYESDLYNVFIDCQSSFCENNCVYQRKLELLVKFEGVANYEYTPTTTTTTTTTTLPSPVKSTPSMVKSTTPKTVKSTRSTTTTSSSSNTAIIGGAIGGVLFIIIIVIIIICCYKRRKENKELRNTAHSPWTMRNNNTSQNNQQPTVLVNNRAKAETGSAYIDPDQWIPPPRNQLTVSTPPPVPDSPRPNNQINNAYAYPDLNETYAAIDSDNAISNNNDNNYAPLNFNSEVYVELSDTKKYEYPNNVGVNTESSQPSRDFYESLGNNRNAPGVNPSTQNIDTDEYQALQ